MPRPVRAHQRTSPAAAANERATEREARSPKRGVARVLTLLRCLDRSSGTFSAHVRSVLHCHVGGSRELRWEARVRVLNFPKVVGNSFS